MNAEIRQRLRVHPVFFGAMAVLMVVSIAVAIVLVRQLAMWRRETREVVRKQQELARLSVASGGATLDEVAALRAQVARVKAELFGVRPSLAAPASVPGSRIEAYADLVAFVERLRGRAARAGVTLATDERFGFGQYAREGPVLDAVPVVWRQRMAVDRLLEGLWAARPQSLAGVWCEAESSHRDTSISASVGPCTIEGLRCRVAFVGGADCLRKYMTTLAAEQQPIIVRAVRAELLPVEAQRQSTVARTKFTLVLELLPQIASVTAPSSETVEPVPSWPAARAQSAGAGWRFEVFEPPIIKYAKERQDWALVGGPAAAPLAGGYGPALIEVRPLPYRWRLVGHGGAGWILFEDTKEGRTLRLRAGERDAGSAVTLVEWRLVRVAGGVMAMEAKVREGDGTDRWLRAGELSLGSELLATLALGEAAARVEAIPEKPVSVDVVQLDNVGITKESLRLVPVRH